jgi:hypothetical protein
MKKNWILWGAVAVGAYLIYKRMNKDNGKEIAPPPVGNTRPPSTFGKPPINTSPVQGKAEGVSSFRCPTKEQMARTRYSQAQMEQLKEMGCI